MNYVAPSVVGRTAPRSRCASRSWARTSSCSSRRRATELPELQRHINAVVKRVGKKLNLVRGPLLERLITDYKALPNWRQRWCTRLIKIQPAIAFLLKRPGSVLSVGLRADEEERVGLYGNYATYRYPLREWGCGTKRRCGPTSTSRAGRDTWPAALDELAQEFCKGRVPRGGDDEDDDRAACRVCRL